MLRVLNFIVAKIIEMKLSELKTVLKQTDKIEIIKPNGKTIPRHFHLTELGVKKKEFIDCGGKVHHSVKLCMQLWSSFDYHHRLRAEKLLKIVNMAEKHLALPDAEIEIEYQGETIENYGLEYENGHFVLVSLNTDCLAINTCGMSAVKEKLSLASLNKNKCSLLSNCC